MIDTSARVGSATRRLCAAARTLFRLLCAALLLVAPVAASAGEWSASASEGLRWRSEDGNAELHAGGVYAGDLVLNDSHNTQGSGLRTDIAKPILEGRYGDAWRARIAGDLEGTKTAANLYEAFVSWQGLPSLRISAGLLQLPLGFEAGTRPEDLSLVAHSFAYFMAPRTDWALRAEGQVAEGSFEWDVAYALGNGFDANGLAQRGARASARAFTRPLRSLGGADASRLESVAAGLFFGGGYAYTWDWAEELRIRNASGTRLFDSHRFDADHAHFYSATIGIESGPVRLVYEGTRGGYFDAETPAGRQDLNDETESWAATLSWMVTGQAYDGRIFGERDRQPPDAGAWEIAVRYANADIDRDFFEHGLTDYATSSQEFRCVTATLSWYATANIRLSAGYVRTLADDDIVSLDFQGDGQAGILRAQFRF